MNPAVSTTLERGRACFRQHAWTDSFELLSDADVHVPLEPADLELLGIAAHVTGHNAARNDALARAYRQFVQCGDAASAARCGFWLGMSLISDGEEAYGGGWLGRANEALASAPECAERGYLLIPSALHVLDSDPEAALQAFEQAAQIAQRCRNSDLAAFANLGKGQALIRTGDVADGLNALDAAMLSVTSGDLLVITAGVVYCAVLIECRRLLDFHRCSEWTNAMTRWCAGQPDMVLYRGQCLVHRSEVLQLHGEWEDAVAEAHRAVARLSVPPQPAIGMAYYQLAELHRLRGEFAEAEQAYQRAVEKGHSPQPGLALLRMTQGRHDAATGALQRLLSESPNKPARAQLLSAFVDVLLAAGKPIEARDAVDELVLLAREVLGTRLLKGRASYASGSVLLAEGAVARACAEFQGAQAIWTELDAPYEAARTHVLLGHACRTLGDVDTAEFEFAAARSIFTRLGARPDLDRMRALTSPHTPILSRRESEVLQLVAAGRTNREIAATLFLSEKTVERHLSGVFTKLGVPNRAAATAYAIQHGMVKSGG